MLYESRIETLFYRVQHPPRASAVMLVALLSSMLCWGCVTVAEHRKLERRVIDAKRTQGGSPARQALAELDAELDDLRGQIRELAGKLEETQRIALRSLEEARRARREAAATAVGSATPNAARKASGSGDGASAGGAAAAVARAGEDATLSEEIKSYQAGIAAWRSRDYRSCIDRFRGFLQTYASSSRADDAAFWIADCHYKQGEFKNAVLRFDDVVRNYPTGNRAPDALYRQGESLLKLGPGFREAARRAFERVLKEYPDSARAVEAKKQLEAVAAG